MIQLKNIDKYYDSRFQWTFILKGVNLEVQQGEMIMKLLKKLNEDGKTIVQVTHNEKYADYCNRIIKLEDGLVREDRLIEAANKNYSSVGK